MTTAPSTPPGTLPAPPRITIASVIADFWKSIIQEEQVVEAKDDIQGQPGRADQVKIRQEIGDAVNGDFREARYAAVVARDPTGQCRAPDQRGLVEDERNPQRGDKRRQAGAPAKGLESDLLDGDVEQRAEEHGRRERQRQQAEALRQGPVRARAEAGDEGRHQHRGQRKHVAMREVKRAGRAVNHRDADGVQRERRPVRQPVDEELEGQLAAAQMGTAPHGKIRPSSGEFNSGRAETPLARIKTSPSVTASPASTPRLGSCRRCSAERPAPLWAVNRLARSPVPLERDAQTTAGGVIPPPTITLASPN